MLLERRKKKQNAHVKEEWKNGTKQKKTTSRNIHLRNNNESNESRTAYQNAAQKKKSSLDSYVVTVTIYTYTKADKPKCTWV